MAAAEIFTDNPTSRGISPRISFSHDLNNSDIVPIEPHIPFNSSLLDSDFNFDFDLTPRNCDQEPSLADELFANGIILPVQIKRKNIPIITKSKSFSPSSSSLSSSSYLPPLAPAIVHHNGETEEKPGNNNNNDNNNNNRSFWRFTRSKSLNCGSICRRGLCPLPILSRSKSTGSTSAKRSLISKEETQHIVNGKQTYLMKNSSYQKPPLKKTYGGGSSFNSGVIQISPVLNVPTGKVFGFGSIFSTTKDKGKKK